MKFGRNSGNSPLLPTFSKERGCLDKRIWSALALAGDGTEEKQGRTNFHEAANFNFVLFNEIFDSLIPEAYLY